MKLSVMYNPPALPGIHAAQRLDSYLLNVQQHDFNKVYRAKTPRAQRQIPFDFSELGVLCVFARIILLIVVTKNVMNPKFQISLVSP